MASVSVSHLIIFIAALTVAVGVATTLTVNVESMSVSLDERGDSVAQDIETDISIISDAGSPDSIYSTDEEGNGEVTLLVKNTGNRPIHTDSGDIDVLINGQYQNAIDIDVIGNEGSTLWAEGEVVRMTVNETLDGGDHRATVRVRSNEDTLRFYWDG